MRAYVFEEFAILNPFQSPQISETDLPSGKSFISSNRARSLLLLLGFLTGIVSGLAFIFPIEFELFNAFVFGMAIWVISPALTFVIFARNIAPQQIASLIMAAVGLLLIICIEVFVLLTCNTGAQGGLMFLVGPFYQWLILGATVLLCQTMPKNSSSTLISRKALTKSATSTGTGSKRSRENPTKSK